MQSPYNSDGELKLTCFKTKSTGECIPNTYLTYLGFEFRGYNTTIKSSNLAKY